MVLAAIVRARHGDRSDRGKVRDERQGRVTTDSQRVSLVGPLVLAVVVALTVGAFTGSVVTRSIVAGDDGTLVSALGALPFEETARLDRPAD